MDVTKDEEHKGQYLADLDELPPPPEWLAGLRQAARRRFCELEFPHRKMESWRFTDVTPILRTPFRALTRPSEHGLTRADIADDLFQESGWSELVFVDGFFAHDLSRIEQQDGLEVRSLLRETMRAGSPLAQHLCRLQNGSTNVFAALNSAFLLDGAYVHAAPADHRRNMVHVVFVTTGRNTSIAIHPRNLIVVEPMSDLMLVESHTYHGQGSPYLNNVVTEIHAGVGSRVDRIKLMRENPQSFHLSETRVSQAQSSRFASFCFALEGKIVRDETAVVLEGEGAECSLNGLYLGEQDQLVDTMCSIQHSAPRCSSWIGYKGVLQDKSRGVFLGRIRVDRHAQQTDSKQLNNNLLLSDRAGVNTRPQLEIFADDVKCTHGATVGPPPEELMFYFRTRGMSGEMARSMLTYGFAGEIVDKVDVQSLRRRLRGYLLNRYRPEESGPSP